MREKLRNAIDLENKITNEFFLCMPCDILGFSHRFIRKQIVFLYFHNSFFFSCFKDSYKWKEQGTNTTATSIASFWQFQCITDSCLKECINKENYSYCANILNPFRHNGPNEKPKHFFFFFSFHFQCEMRSTGVLNAIDEFAILNIQHTGSSNIWWNCQ